MTVWNTVVAIWSVVTAIASVVGAVFGAVMAVITSPITLIILAIVALIAIVVLLWKNWDTVTKALGAAWDWIKEKAAAIFNWLKEFLSGLWQGIKDKAIAVWNAVKEFLANLWQGIKDKVSAVWNGIKEFLAGAWEAIKTKARDAFTALKDKLKEIWENVKDAVKDKIQALIDFVKDLPGDIIDAIGNFNDLLYNKGKDLIQGLIDGIKSMAGSIWNAIKGIIPDWVPGFGGTTTATAASARGLTASSLGAGAARGRSARSRSTSTATPAATHAPSSGVWRATTSEWAAGQGKPSPGPGDAMAGYDNVAVRCGADYAQPPITGQSRIPADVLTNIERWGAVSGTGLDITHPTPVPEARGMRLSWTTTAGQNAVQGMLVGGLVPGRVYSFIATVEPSAATQWRLSIVGRTVSTWVATSRMLAIPNWEAPAGVTAAYFGIETSGPQTTTHLVTQIGVWDHGDVDNHWHLFDLAPCNVALPLEITHGRSAIGTQPDSPSCDFTWLGEVPPGAIGDRVEVALQTLSDDGASTTERIRFSGVVAGMKAQEENELVRTWAVACIGHQARLGTVPVTITRPAETDVARAQSIAVAAGVNLTVLGTPGVVLAADVVDGDALAAFQEVCGSSGGLFWQAPDGRFTYGAADHRGDTSADVVGILPCAALGDGLDWDEAMESVVNSVKVSWGPAEGGTRSESTYTDPGSIGAPWGLRHQDISTICNTEPDAEQFAQLVLARRRFPFWTTPDALVYVDLLAPADARMVALLDVGHAVLVPFSTDPGPVPSVLTAVIVEGWIETWDEAGHTVQYAVSDQRRWGRTTLRTWAEAKVENWAHWKLGSWIDALVKENI